MDAAVAESEKRELRGMDCRGEVADNDCMKEGTQMRKKLRLPVKPVCNEGWRGRRKGRHGRRGRGGVFISGEVESWRGSGLIHRAR